MVRSSIRFACAIVVACLALHAPRVLAAAERNVFTEYNVSSWSRKDGLPPGTVGAIAQDMEGYLWVGTESGLRRFDGVRFTEPDALTATKLPRKPVRALLQRSDGTLWIGFLNGGVSAISGGAIRNFEGGVLPSTTVSALAEDNTGLWAGTDAGLFRYDGDRWSRFGRDKGLPDGAVYSAMLDRSHGDLYVGISAGIYRLARDAAQFECFEAFADHPKVPYENPRALVGASDETVYVSDPITGFRVVGLQPGVPIGPDRGRGRALLYDRANNLWVGTSGQGLWRVRRQAQTNRNVAERLTTVTRLLSDGVVSIYEDRDGNIWVGTTEGLNLLTRSRIAQITGVGLVTAIESKPSGDLWAGTSDELIRFADPSVDVPTDRLSLRGESLRALHADPGNHLWIATDRFVGEVTGDHLTPVLSVGKELPAAISHMASDGAGGLWMEGAPQGLFHWNGHSRTVDRVPTVAAAEALMTDHSGRLWLAFVDGTIGIVDQSSRLRVLGKDDGVVGGPYRALHEDSSGNVWLAGPEGLTRFADGEFQTVHRGAGFPLVLTAAIDDGSGDLYLGSGTGIAKVDTDNFVEAVTSGTLAYTLYDRADGLAGFPRFYGTDRRVIRSRDNRLWFITARGLTVIDPRSLREPRTPPAVRIESVRLAESELPARSEMLLPPNTSRFEIEYTVLELAVPFRTRFRYRLDGFDADWVDAGSRRQASYTNLPPGHYRFRVQASTTDGAWNSVAAELAFGIRPTFFQTRWFYASIVMAVGIGLLSAWKFRLHRVRRQFALLLGERVRVSRDIHDTLLQSLVGLALQLDSVATDRDALPEAARDQFAYFRRLVQQYIREARQSIWDLRSPRMDSIDLIAGLRNAADRLPPGTAARSNFSTTGTPRPCPRAVAEQLIRIGREAVGNAARHAGASTITVHLNYGANSIEVYVSDDGVGFNLQEQLAKGNTHYGLMTMRERAQDIGGELDIQSAAGLGTQIAVTFPTTNVVAETGAAV